MIVRTRFAPSPTGYLHVGGARTALYSYLYAKRNGGKYGLRLEDTDLERSTESAVKAIFEGLEWLGLKEDEGPFFQTQRFPRYFEVIKQMLEQGTAYRCYCSKERIDNLRAEQEVRKEKPRYDGKCRHLKGQDTSQPHVIRFRNPDEGSVVWDDLILDRIEITHVVRGNDHVSNTPKQINLLRALNAPVPQYGHLPMILGSDGQKLSKRHGAVSVIQYRDEGFLPQALLNYLVRLGWSHGDQEIFSMEEMIELFDLNKVNKSAAAFDPKKLLWLNHHYIKTLPAEEVAQHLEWHMADQSIHTGDGPALAEVVRAQAERCDNLRTMASASRYFYQDVDQYDEAAVAKQFNATSKAALAGLLPKLQALSEWNAAAIHGAMDAVCQEQSIGFGKIGPALRIALTGAMASPSIDLTAELIGRERVIERVQNALKFIAEKGI